MIPLPQKLRKNGFVYNLVLRGRRTCIYSQWSANNLISFEVFKIKTRPLRKVKGIWLEARERFPRDEDFGYSAWTIKDWGKAKRKFDTLEYNE